jgi:mRNA-degrading endonuclease RelE of RelBE toxin-antitoxin system
MAFAIFYSPEAVDHLAALPRDEQVMVVNEVELQLTHQPTLATQRRKMLRPNAIAPWELRLGDIRVFYSIQEQPTSEVFVKAMARKSTTNSGLAARGSTYENN